MKNKSIIMTFILAAITCCLMTSCKKEKETCDITIVNTTSDYGLQIYWDGRPEYYEDARLDPGTSTFILGGSYGYEIKLPVDIKIEYYEKTVTGNYASKPHHSYSKEAYQFKSTNDYKITVRNNDFTIQGITK